MMSMRLWSTDFLEGVDKILSNMIRILDKRRI